MSYVMAVQPVTDQKWQCLMVHTVMSELVQNSAET